jgi:hypothetical protein
VQHRQDKTWTKSVSAYYLLACPFLIFSPPAVVAAVDSCRRTFLFIGAGALIVLINGLAFNIKRRHAREQEESSDVLEHKK